MKVLVLGVLLLLCFAAPRFVRAEEEEDDQEDDTPKVEVNSLVARREVLDGEAQKVLNWLLEDSPFSYLAKKAGGPWSDTFFGYTSVADPTPLVKRTPVVIIPSLIGNALEARLENRQSKYWWCTKNYYAWYRIYLDLGAFIPKTIDCWFESMTLQWDPATQLSKNASGVFIRPREFGGVEGVEYVDQIGLMGLYNDTVSVLKSIGYTPGKDLRAATYDWRLSPYQLSIEYFPQLKNLVEEVYRDNGNSKVSFISLSMGSAVFHRFLATVPQQWKDTYVKEYYSLDGAWGGSLSSVMSLLTDKSFYGYTVSGLGTGLVATIRTWPSVVFMMPWIEIYGNDRIFVTSPTKNYTAKDFPQMMRDVNAPHTAQMVESLVSKGMTKLQPPGIPIYCIHGHNVPTIVALKFNTTTLDSAPEFVKADGDGTVPIEGLNMCQTWKNQQSQPAIDMPVKNMFHGSSAHNKDVLAFLVHKLLVA